ncbi:hypothetical protein [Nocardia crassostreae]|uniref:hypothetical protein n=1 Tax=Nocardia crassostreae TaxID=53428 RepID=UPI0008312A50|nr:hypothetical protein [Nocardia crassostreae]
MTFKADLEILGKLGTTLHGLAQEAAQAKPKEAESPAPDEPLLSGVAAGQIMVDLVDNSLIPAAKERLSETGDVMINAVSEFASAEESSVDRFVTLYNQATGDWTVEGAR